MADTEFTVERDVPRSRVEAVYRELRNAIINGEYEPGSHLRLQELAETFDVSLIPVREAIRRLEAERLVETYPNRGAWVAEMSAEDVTDSFRARLLVETEAIRMALPNLGEAAIARARATMERMSEAFQTGDLKSGFQLHRELHFLLYERSGSRWLVYIIELLWAHTERYRKRTKPDPRGGEHTKMLDALAEGQIEAAVEALRIDLERTAKSVIEGLGKSANGAETSDHGHRNPDIRPGASA